MHKHKCILHNCKLDKSVCKLGKSRFSHGGWHHQQWRHNIDSHFNSIGICGHFDIGQLDFCGQCRHRHDFAFKQIGSKWQWIFQREFDSGQYHGDGTLSVSKTASFASTTLTNFTAAPFHSSPPADR